MNVQLTKSAGEDKQVLNIHFNENDQAIVDDHSPEESIKIITAFIEGKDDAKPESKNTVGVSATLEGKDLDKLKSKSDVQLVLAGETEYNFGKDNWEGQKFVLNKGILRIQDDIDPAIEVKNDSLLIYDGFSAVLSEQQQLNIHNVSEDSTVAFDDCYLNCDLRINGNEAGIDDGAFERIFFCTDCGPMDRLTERKSIHISNGAHVDSLMAGTCSHVDVNTEMCSGDEKQVTIDKLIIDGTGKLDNCYIGNLVIGSQADVEIYGSVGHACVSGTAYIDECSDVTAIHLHIGGRIHGSLENINIDADRAFTLRMENNELWIVG